ncbi:MAG TPA: glycine cleavage system protein H [Candidatus Hypogeohydataceae bacterium YC40]
MARYEDIFLPDEFYYDRKDHLWAKIEGGSPPEADRHLVRVGLDIFGQKAAGTAAYIKLLPVGKTVAKGRSFGSLEAGKYIGPLKAPAGGKIIEVNQEVISNPRYVNTDPYGKGWFVVIEPNNLQEDIKDLVQGTVNIQEWLEKEYKKYKEKGLFAEK